MIEQPLMHKNNKNSISITITKTYKDLKVKHEYIIHLIIETIKTTFLILKLLRRWNWVKIKLSNVSDWINEQSHNFCTIEFLLLGQNLNQQ